MFTLDKTKGYKGNYKGLKVIQQRDHEKEKGKQSKSKQAKKEKVKCKALCYIYYRYFFGVLLFRVFSLITKNDTSTTIKGHARPNRDFTHLLLI